MKITNHYRAIGNLIHAWGGTSISIRPLQKPAYITHEGKAKRDQPESRSL